MALLLLAPAVSAADGNTNTIDPTGTWKWTYAAAGGQTVEAKLKLRLEAGKLTGVALGVDGQETAIEKPTLETNQLRFQVSRQIGEKKFTTQYQGLISADRIKGQAISGREPYGVVREWEAVRAKDQSP